MTQKENLLFIECALVFAFLLVPPLFSSVPFTLPPKPEGLYAQCVFCFYTVYAAAYEEVLYRLYTPNRLHRIYAGYIEPRLQKNPPAAAEKSFCRKTRCAGTVAISFKACMPEYHH